MMIAAGYCKAVVALDMNRTAVRTEEGKAEHYYSFDCTLVEAGFEPVAVLDPVEAGRNHHQLHRSVEA